MTLLDSCDQLFCSNINYLSRVLATLTVSTAEVERSFSSLKRIKTHLIDSIERGRITGSAVLSVHHSNPVVSAAKCRNKRRLLFRPRLMPPKRNKSQKDSHLFLFLIHKASLAELQLGEEYDKLGQRTSQSGRNTYKRISSKIAGGRRPGAKAGEEYVTSSIRHDSQCRGRESYDVRLIDGCPARLLEVSDHSRICSAEFCPEEAFITVTPVGLQVQMYVVLKMPAEGSGARCKAASNGGQEPFCDCRGGTWRTSPESLRHIKLPDVALKAYLLLLLILLEELMDELSKSPVLRLS
ncbi:hypothetical protein J6590_007019 [Homalodisca vitripennis]|nr:hypothetical protein J6590_007019 [Homalodisca vitripennis]